MARPVCAVIGIGPGNGAAFARRFSAEGYQVALLSRSETYLRELAGEIDGSRPYTYDAQDIAQAPDTFTRIREEMGPIEVLVYNAGSGVFGSIDDATAADLEAAWRINTLGCFAATQQVLPDMRAAKKGSIVVIGATASLRGGASFAAFASAKAAQRSLAQSMARLLGREGIHVSYVIIDGVIDLPRTRERLPDKDDEFFLRPADIADAVFWLTRQERSAWTFELDVRPFAEKW